MEIVTRLEETGKIHVPPPRPSNDNNSRPVSMGRSTFPEGTLALIGRLSTVGAGNRRRRGWRLVFECRSAPFIEPLMGYTGTDDALAGVELYFQTLQAAVTYANRQGLAYVVQKRGAERETLPRHGAPHPPRSASHDFSDATLERLGLGRLQECYGLALDGAVSRGDPSGAGSWWSPMDIVRDPALSLDAKRSILMNWAWTEFLMEQATNQGMPENNRPARLDEVEQALLALERQVEGRDQPPMMSRSAA